jgi:hypothetical protein
MSNPLLTKYVEFKATGLKQVVTQTQNYEKTAKRAEAANRALAKSITEGSFGRAIEAMKQSRLKMESEIRRNQMLSYQARYGGMGGQVAYQANRFGDSRVGRGIGYAASAGAAAYVGGAMSGLNDTIEGNRLEMKKRQLEREMAGTMKPQIDAFTEAIGNLAKWMNRQSEGTRTVIGGAAATVVIAAAAQMAMNAMGMGGVIPRLISGGAGYATNVVGGALSYLGGGSIAKGGGIAAAATGTILSAGYLSTTKAKEQGLGGAMNATPMGLWTAIGSLARGESLNQAGRDVSTGAKSGLNELLWKFGIDVGAMNGGPSMMGRDEAIAKQQAEEEKTAARTRVTLAGGGFGQAGEAYYRLSESYSKTASLTEEQEIQKSLKETLDRLNSNLEAQNKQELR